MTSPDVTVQPVGTAFAAELTALGTFGVLCDGEVVRLDELTALELGAVQRQAGVSWVDLLQSPTADLLGALALVEACEAHADVARTAGTLTVVELLERIVRVAPVLEVVQPGAQQWRRSPKN
jgi:hypothetical protein